AVAEPDTVSRGRVDERPQDRQPAAMLKPAGAHTQRRIPTSGQSIASQWGWAERIVRRDGAKSRGDWLGRPQGCRARWHKANLAGSRSPLNAKIPRETPGIATVARLTRRVVRH